MMRPSGDIRAEIVIILRADDESTVACGLCLGEGGAKAVSENEIERSEKNCRRR